MNREDDGHTAADSRSVSEAEPADRTASPRLRRRQTKVGSPGKGYRHTLVLTLLQLLVIAAVMLPLLWMISVSFKPDNEPFAIPARLWPQKCVLRLLFWFLSLSAWCYRHKLLFRLAAPE